MRFQHIAILLFTLITTSLIGCEEGLQETVNDTQPIDLKFKLFADSAYQYTIKSQVNIEQELDTQNTTSINQNMTLTTTYRVKSIQKEQTNISITYDRITLNIGNQLMALDYDSQNDDGTIPMYEDLRQLIDKTYKIGVSPTGKILSSEPVIKSKSKNTVGINDSSLRAIMIHSLHLYPKHKVSVDDVWQHNYTTSVAFANVRVKSNFQLKSVVNGIAKVEMQSRLTSNDTEQQEDTEVNINGVQSGSFDIEVRSGMVISGRIKQELSGDMNITGQTTPTQLEGSIHIMGTKK